MKRFIPVLLLLISLNAAAQEQETTDSVSTQKSKSSLMARLHQVQQYLDTKAKKKVDPHYIEVPEKPWRVVLRYNASVFDVDYSNSVSDPRRVKASTGKCALSRQWHLPLVCGQAIVVRESLFPSLSTEKKEQRYPSAPPEQSTGSISG